MEVDHDHNSIRSRPLFAIARCTINPFFESISCEFRFQVVEHSKTSHKCNHACCHQGIQITCDWFVVSVNKLVGESISQSLSEAHPAEFSSSSLSTSRCRILCPFAIFPPTLRGAARQHSTSESQGCCHTVPTRGAPNASSLLCTGTSNHTSTSGPVLLLLFLPLESPSLSPHSLSLSPPTSSLFLSVSLSCIHIQPLSI